MVRRQVSVFLIMFQSIEGLTDQIIYSNMDEEDVSLHISNGEHSKSISLLKWYAPEVVQYVL